MISIELTIVGKRLRVLPFACKGFPFFTQAVQADR